ncbi:RTA1 like protein-domain-containing protein [Tricladium varicosporioides]|nr:RTA1 like protein-domain-containing protein [Hymenoscyphus varicosporioides]
MAKSAFYNYEPSAPAAIIFIALFGITTTIHVWQIFRSKAWFLVPFIIGGLFEFIGYICRMLSAKEAPNYSKGPYIIQSLLLLLGPAFFAASIYMILGRIILLTDGESHSPIKQRWLTKIFVTGDIVSFLAQAAGGVILSSAASTSSQKSTLLGQKVIIIGLCVQILFFGIFIFTSLLFHIRMNKEPTSSSSNISIQWHKHIWALYAANALIMIRSIFRVVEYVQGKDGILQSKEVFLYVFDAALMVAVMMTLSAVHPSQIMEWLKGKGARETHRGSDTEMQSLTNAGMPAHKVAEGEGV